MESLSSLLISLLFIIKYEFYIIIVISIIMVIIIIMVMISITIIVIAIVFICGRINFYIIPAAWFTNMYQVSDQI